MAVFWHSLFGSMACGRWWLWRPMGPAAGPAQGPQGLDGPFDVTVPPPTPPWHPCLGVCMHCACEQGGLYKGGPGPPGAAGGIQGDRAPRVECWKAEAGCGHFSSLPPPAKGAQVGPPLPACPWRLCAAAGTCKEAGFAPLSTHAHVEAGT